MSPYSLTFQSLFQSNERDNDTLLVTRHRVNAMHWQQLELLPNGKWFLARDQRRIIGDDGDIDKARNEANYTNTRTHTHSPYKRLRKTVPCCCYCSCFQHIRRGIRERYENELCSLALFSNKNRLGASNWLLIRRRRWHRTTQPPYISSSGGITIMIGMVYKETTKSHEKAIVFLIKVDSDSSSSSSSSTEEKKMERKTKEKL